ncbi:MAG: T9SS type A sorting domain-containing protein [Chitinispirillales bacterium]|jgi:GH18 family chitinase|nr:T9SS type A sorting domain-containing protein [Chitinispirillales bacterium]
MEKFPFVFIVLLFCINSFCAEKYAGYKLVGYIPTWNSGLNGDPSCTNEREINKIDFSKITHAIVAFINSDANGNLTIPEDLTASPWSHEQAADTIIARSKRNGVKVFISLGSSQDGWEMTKSPTARTNFSKQIKQYLISHNFDGLDLDLEGGWDVEHPFYSEEYTLLTKELRDTLGNDFYLTSAVGATNDQLWTDNFLSALDWINIMIYDLHMWWRGDIRNDSGFDDQLEAANTWSKRLPKEKLVFGAPFYGHGWDFDNNKRYYYDINWWHAKNITDSSQWNWYQNDYLIYFILDSLFDLSPEQDSIIVTQNDKLWIDIENTYMGFRGAHNGIIYFNGQNLLKKKAKWAIDGGYGGIMIWELGLDVPTSHPHSLLNALAEQFYESTKNIHSTISAKVVKTAKPDFLFSLQNRTLRIFLSNVNPAKITVSDCKGRILFSQTASAKEVFVALNKKHFADGIYLLNVSQNGAVKSTNFLLKN